MIRTPRPLGAILAGGQSRRMGTEKALVPLAGRPLIAWVADRLAPQVDGLLVNANGEPARFAALGLPVVADAVPGHPGPLAGILAALDWARAHRPRARAVLTVPTDCPFLPTDLAGRLVDALAQGAPAAVAASGGRRHPVIGLWPVELAEALRAALVVEGLRRAEQWVDRCGGVAVDFPGAPADPFLNVNSPGDVALAAARIVTAARPGAES
jgi:molybdopterin-guanine dinucleotide biosynthesis protein A